MGNVGSSRRLDSDAGLLPAGHSAYFDDEADMRRYIGPNWPKYRDLWLAMKGAPAYVPSRCYAAAVLTSLWLLYRKRYALAFGVMALQLIVTFTLLDFGGLIDLAIALVLGRYGKSIVVRDGLAAIARIRGATGAADDDGYSRIVRAGGTNIVAPIAGALIAGALIAGLFVANWRFLVASGEPPGDAAALLNALRALHDAAMQNR
jgi:hypothetical protein